MIMLIVPDYNIIGLVPSDWIVLVVRILHPQKLGLVSSPFRRHYGR